MEADIFRKVYSQVSIRWGVWNSTGRGGGVLENISKTNSQGGRKNLENLTAGGGVGGGRDWNFVFSFFLF